AKSGWHNRFDEWITNAVILSPASTQDYSVEVGLNPEGEVATIVTTEEYRESLRYMKRLYDLGAIYDGNFTQTEEQLRSLANQEGEPVLFLPAGTISNHFDADSNNETYRHYQVMAPIAGPDGTRLATHMKYNSVGIGEFFVTDKCKYPEAALRWIDYFFTTEGALSSHYGPEEGKDWVLNPEGMKGLNGEPALYQVLNPYSGEAQNHDWQDLQVRYFPTAFRLGEAADQNIDVGTSVGLEKLLYESTKEKMEPYAQKEGDWDVLPYLRLTDEEATKIQTIGVEVQNYIEENRVAFITGKKDLDTDWDKFVKEFDNLGLPTLLEVYQTAYERQSGE
ncbi:MAG: ABC transporter substrate-binding protein, partial [Lachnospiraceae bacterium]